MTDWQRKRDEAAETHMHEYFRRSDLPGPGSTHNQIFSAGADWCREEMQAEANELEDIIVSHELQIATFKARAEKAEAAIGHLRSAAAAVIADVTKNIVDWRDPKTWSDRSDEMESQNVLLALEHALSATSGYEEKK